MIFITALYWFVLALLFALLEIENEGKYGGGEKSQTWYRKKKNYPKLITRFIGEKPLTGYHIFVFLVAFAISHAHFFMGVEWSLTNELIALSIYFAWTPLWDYLWFIFNPNYESKKFKRSTVWWYSKSIWFFDLMPLGHVIQWFLSIFLSFMTYLITSQISVFYSHLLFTIYLTILTLFAYIFISPIYKKWYKNMRKYDDRDKANI